MYGVNQNRIAVKFDGSSIPDSETPANLGIEDDDLIDIGVKLKPFIFYKLIKNY